LSEPGIEVKSPKIELVELHTHTRRCFSSAVRSGSRRAAGYLEGRPVRYGSQGVAGTARQGDEQYM
jgi:hypothetical protein